MEHLINDPIEAHELQSKRRHIETNVVKLCFFYHRGLAVGYDVVIEMHGHSFIGTVGLCKMVGDDLFKCEVLFMDETEAFKVRMMEQAARIERYREENPHLSLEQAANEWIAKNGALFPER